MATDISLAGRRIKILVENTNDAISYPVENVKSYYFDSSSEMLFMEIEKEIPTSISNDRFLRIPVSQLTINGAVPADIFDAQARLDDLFINAGSAALKTIPDDYTITASDNGSVLLYQPDVFDGVIIYVGDGIKPPFSVTIIDNSARGPELAPANLAAISNRQAALKSAGQYAVFTLIAIAENSFVVAGDLIAV